MDIQRVKSGTLTKCTPSKSGLIPGGKSLRKDRQSVFFTAVNPMCARQDVEGVEYDLDKPRIASYKHSWKAPHNTENW